MKKKQSRSRRFRVVLVICLASALLAPSALTDTSVWRSHSSGYDTTVAALPVAEPIKIADSRSIVTMAKKTIEPAVQPSSKAIAAVRSVKPGVSGAMIVVTGTKPPQQVGGGGCSLVEAIYSANFDDNVAIDSINPDHFVPTECVKGNGNDTIVLPANAVFEMSSIINDAHN
ncbi:MAG TPA: hypothetical protein VNO24_10615, partial [Blastocatellia bacterium]|nr:hypothetical protein [Blastocatellia bacterium]